MRTSNAIRIAEKAAVEFEDDDLDWVLGELDHAIDEAKKRGSLLYKCDPHLVQAACDFFRRYHQRLDFSQARPDFDSVRISDEEWNRCFREKIRKICAEPSAKPVASALRKITT